MMDLDLRVPIGLFFVAVGLIMGIFGLISDPAIYHKSFGINVNLYWGLVELIFGSLMIAFGRPRRAAAPLAAPVPATVGAPAKPVLVGKAASVKYDDAAPREPKPKPPVTHG